MIGDREVDEAARALGVDADQVRRDHLISHVLHHLAGVEVVFFGGTALTRTHLDATRLSEDIDLLADDNDELADRLAENLPRSLRQEFLGVTWEEIHRNSRVLTATLTAPDMATLKIQIVRTEPHERKGEYELREVDLRYSDLPPSVSLVVPTRPTFTAMKLAAWADRKAPRDLFDLAGLAEIGAVDEEAAAMHRRVFGHLPVVFDFTKLPPRVADAWVAELGHQTAELPAADDCLERVRAAVEAARSSAA